MKRKRHYLCAPCDIQTACGRFRDEIKATVHKQLTDCKQCKAFIRSGHKVPTWARV